MTRELIAQLSERMGFAVALDDFVPCGIVKANAVGLERCQSGDLTKTLRRLDEQLKAEPPAGDKKFRASEMMFVLTMLMLCGDAEGKATVTDEDAADFLETNRTPLARLRLPAYAAALPALVQNFGIEMQPQTGAKS